MMNAIPYKKLVLGIGILIVLTPLGLWLPEWFRAGAAWGEWGPDELKSMLENVPAQLAKGASLWKGIIRDYQIGSDPQLWRRMAGYLISAVLGTGMVVGLTYLLGKWLTRSEDCHKNLGRGTQ